MRFKILILCVAAYGLVGSFAFAQPPQPLWTRVVGTLGNDQGRAVVPDGIGGAFIVGTTPGGLVALNPQGLRQAFIIRFDAAGEQLWGRQLGGSSGGTFAVGAAPGPAGGAYIGGDTRASLGGPNMGETDAWVGRYSEDGELLWVRQLGSDLPDTISAMGSDGAGGVFFAGVTYRALGGPVIGLQDVFVGRYDADGELLWLIQIGTPATDYLGGICPDGTGGFFIGGSTTGSWGGANAGLEDAWLARYTGEGSQIWLRQFGTYTADFIQAIADDGAGGAYLSGGTYGSLGGSAAGNADAFTGRFDADGNQLWLRQLGTIHIDSARAVASDGAGGCYVAGETGGSLAGPSSGSNDVLLARYSGSGQLLWMTQWGTTKWDRAWEATPAANGGVYVTGEWGQIGSTLSYSDVFLTRFPGPCYANCDNTTAAPVLNVADFACFLQKFAAGDPYANCDQSALPPTLNVADFSCFLQKFAAGCS